MLAHVVGSRRRFLHRALRLGVLHVVLRLVAAVADALLGDVAELEVRFSVLRLEVDQEEVLRGECKRRELNGSSGGKHRAGDVGVVEVQTHRAADDVSDRLELEVADFQTAAIDLAMR